MTHILLSKGKTTGNAIIANIHNHLILGKTYTVITDYGNVMILTESELNQLFTISHKMDLQVWLRDKDRLHNNLMKNYYSGTKEDNSQYYFWLGNSNG